ncbi:hypothetical protein LINPERPRIM_LOCUS9368 [Linum perenne]
MSTLIVTFHGQLGVTNGHNPRCKRRMIASHGSPSFGSRATKCMYFRVHKWIDPTILDSAQYVL